MGSHVGWGGVDEPQPIPAVRAAQGKRAESDHSLDRTAVEKVRPASSGRGG